MDRWGVDSMHTTVLFHIILVHYISTICCYHFYAMLSHCTWIIHRVMLGARQPTSSGQTIMSGYGSNAFNACCIICLVRDWLTDKVRCINISDSMQVTPAKRLHRSSRNMHSPPNKCINEKRSGTQCEYLDEVASSITSTELPLSDSHSCQGR